MIDIYEYTFSVSEEAIDENGHVNNVVYLRWLLDAAEAHAIAVGGDKATSEIGATWFIRAHRIDYLRPAFLDNQLTIQTWVASVRRVQSTRKYKILRGDETVVEAETDWVLVDARTGRPQKIPQSIMDCFVVVENETI